MNIEEARKHLKKNLNNWKKSKKDYDYIPEIIEEINTDYEAIETLLTAYEKEKEHNSKLLEALDTVNHEKGVFIESYEKEKEKNKKAIDFINDKNNYFEDGENWQNILKIKDILEE